MGSTSFSDAKHSTSASCDSEVVRKMPSTSQRKPVKPRHPNSILVEMGLRSLKKKLEPKRVMKINKLTVHTKIAKGTKRVRSVEANTWLKCPAIDRHITVNNSITPYKLALIVLNKAGIFVLKRARTD